MSMDHGAVDPGNLKQRAAASRVLASAKTPLLPVVPRHAFRVLQTARAPAQMALFLR
jgi:hypothetical protein